MTLTPIASSSSAPIELRLPVGGIGERQRAFLDAIGRHGVELAPGDRSESTDDQPDRDAARQAAEQFVATTFLQPILKELRAQNRAEAPFGPTEAEKTLGPLMDAQLADRMVRSHQFGLVDRIAADLRQRSAVVT